MPDAPQDAPSNATSPIRSVCVYCASSNAADPLYLAQAEAFGKILAREGVRLVYGGGGVGLMGAVARGAHGAGGQVLGIMPAFLRRAELLYDAVETRVVHSMHERKQMLFEESDAFAILPGGIGTLEEIVELMSWRRLELHRKPMVFLDPGGFWQPLFALLDHIVAQRLTPDWFNDTWSSVEEPEAILPAMHALLRSGPQGDPMDLI